jgi:hypothetical protein
MPYVFYVLECVSLRASDPINVNDFDDMGLIH